MLKDGDKILCGHPVTREWTCEPRSSYRIVWNAISPANCSPDISHCVDADRETIHPSIFDLYLSKFDVRSMLLFYGENSIFLTECRVSWPRITHPERTWENTTRYGRMVLQIVSFLTQEIYSKLFERRFTPRTRKEFSRSWVPFFKSFALSCLSAARPWSTRCKRVGASSCSLSSPPQSSKKGYWSLAQLSRRLSIPDSIRLVFSENNHHGNTPDSSSFNWYVWWIYLPVGFDGCVKCGYWAIHTNSTIFGSRKICFAMYFCDPNEYNETKKLKDYG